MPCYLQKNKRGGFYYLCGDLGPHCHKCMQVGDYLCDYPVGDGKTCDAPMCGDHSTEIAPEIHYCESHLKLWNDFVDSGGLKNSLENVVPYKTK